MTVESLVFIGLGLLVTVLLVKIAIAENTRIKQLVPSAGKGVTNSANSTGNSNGREIEHIQNLEVHIVGKEKHRAAKECAPTAELQTIDNIEAIQRVQILISKGQTIEAVQYLCDNAGYKKDRALALVDSMGKKVYSSD